MHGADPHRYLTPEGWQPVRLTSTPAGRISTVSAASSDVRRYAIPGIQNTHSHAFQRAMAGLTERQTHPADSFWTWREQMYHFAGRLDPDSQYVVASQLYAEMLEAGYTSVCEFHYLHHQPDGQPYADPAAMSHALIAAAVDTGIRMTLLPVLYMTAGFDERELEPRQRRFGHDLDAFLRLVEILRVRENPQLRVGIALHSLRAIPKSVMPALADVLSGLEVPVHIHIAEQRKEVEQCLALRGARPVRWLLDHAPVDSRWTLVHATHLLDEEVADIAAREATVSICPTTEANLGDGLFPLRKFLDAGGRISIGSDSHVSVSPVEELRWLEYGQRLHALRRTIAASEQEPSAGAALLRQVWRGGAASSGFASGAIAADHVADWLVLDGESPMMAGANDETVLDRLVFAGNRSLIDEVYVGGRRVVEGGRHRNHEPIAMRYGATLRRLLAS